MQWSRFEEEIEDIKRRFCETLGRDLSPRERRYLDLSARALAKREPYASEPASQRRTFRLNRPHHGQFGDEFAA